MEYPFGQKGWRLYDIEEGKFFVSRDVKFMETEFPYAPGPDLASIAASPSPSPVDGGVAGSNLIADEETATQADHTATGNGVRGVLRNPRWWKAM